MRRLRNEYRQPGMNSPFLAISGSVGKMEEILASQKQMLIRRGESTDTISDEKMTSVFQEHLNKVDELIEQKKNLDVVFISYNDVIENPLENIKTVNDFLGNILDEDNMVKAVDKSLHRQRK